MYILIAITLVVAAVICFFVPDPLPMVEELILVASSVFTFIKGIAGTKEAKTPEDYIAAGAKKAEDDDDDDEESDESVYVYKPPMDKKKTPKGYPKYDKNNPDAVYYYKKD